MFQIRECDQRDSKFLDNLFQKKKLLFLFSHINKKFQFENPMNGTSVRMHVYGTIYFVYAYAILVHMVHFDSACFPCKQKKERKRSQDLNM